jgi:glycosyltransferase involved in cell wall biosynthesis
MFSIIIPTFNRENLILKALNSIQQQNYKNYEIIVVDDCSTDNTLSLIKNLNIINLKIISLKKNQGPGFARNEGIKFAKGEWIMFLDSDDVFLDNKFDEILKIKNFDKYQFIVHDNIIKNSQTNMSKIIRNGTFIKILQYHMLNYQNEISLSSSLIKKKFIIDNKLFFPIQKKFIGVEDYIFWFNILTRTSNGLFLKKILSCNFINNDNLSKFYNTNLILLKKNAYAVQYMAKNLNKNFNKKKYLLLHALIKLISNKKHIFVIKIIKKRLYLTLVVFLNFFLLKFFKFLYGFRI